MPAAAPRPVLAGRITRAAVFTALAGCWTNKPATEQTTPEPDHHDQTTDTAHTTDTTAATGSIEGTIVDGNGAVAGATVVLDGRTVANADGQGRYHFDHVALGTHQIQISTQGNRNHGGGRVAQVTVVVERSQVARGDAQLVDPTFDPSNIPKPYGAPPARRRIV